MRKGIFGVLVAALFVIASAIPGACGPLDPAYIEAFGHGALIASGRGFPVAFIYDFRMFDFREGVFYIDGGKGSTLDLRMIMPLGKPVGIFYQRLRFERDQLEERVGNKSIIFKIWPSFDHLGRNLVDDLHPWPSRAGDEPGWGMPILIFKELDQNSATWHHVGCSWESESGLDLAPILDRAVPGHRFFISFHVGYECQSESGEFRLVSSAAIATCTIEVRSRPGPRKPGNPDSLAP